jgi:hypothetical protein
MTEALFKHANHNSIDLAGHRENFLMANEYQDFIEFLQDKLGFEHVAELQKEFDELHGNLPEDGKTD